MNYALRAKLTTAVVVGVVCLAYIGYSWPRYFTSSYLVSALLLECLVAAVVLYRVVFFPVVVVTFLLSGLNLPVGSGWAEARWIVLGAGAFIGLLGLFKYHHFFGLFHGMGALAVLAAMASASDSQAPRIALLKALSLLLLFTYCSTGVRMAAIAREGAFFENLVIGCEILVVGVAALHAVGIEAMGNPNSLGAVMGVVAAPILLWGSFVSTTGFARWRRSVLLIVSLYLLLFSHARAGMAAVLVCSGWLCLSLRKYKQYLLGLCALTAVLAAQGLLRPEVILSRTNSILYKNDPTQLGGVFASRRSPWTAAINNLSEHLWTGTGFGTTAIGDSVKGEADSLSFRSSSTITTENGSSYLTIVTGVGVLGILPFLCLILMLAREVVRTTSWMRLHNSLLHPAVPLAMVVSAGLVHAAFEDWLFAPGYYLCVFFWSLAFLLSELAPASARNGALTSLKH